MSKGSSRRPRKISALEEDLRWELMRKDTAPERKEEIKRQLEELRQCHTGQSK